MGYILFRLDPTYSKCPSCNAINSLHRSRARKFSEKIIKVVGFLKIYRCKNCGWRGIRSTIVITSKSLKNFGYVLLMAVVAGLIIFQILKRFL